MAFSEALRLVVDADTRGAVQGIERLGATADRELSRSEKRLDQWGHKLTSLGTGMIAFGGAALVGLGALARQSEEANLAQVKLQNTIDNMPKLAGASASEFTDLAESIQKVTAADADAIVEAEALLGTFSLTADEIKGIIPLVTDYSRKFGPDMSDAAIQVGKALDGQLGALKRNGVSIDEVLFKTDRYRAVSEALSDQVGGFAEAEGKTFAGSLERMKNELGDLAEGVGGGAVDAFTTMFSAVEKVTGALDELSPGAQNTIGKIATFGAVGLVAVGAINVLVGQALQFKTSLDAMGTGLSTATTKLGGLRAAASIAAGAAGLAGLVLVAKQIADSTDDLKINIDGLSDALFSTSEKTRAGTQEFISLIDNMDRLESTFDKVLDASVPTAEQFIKTAEAAGVSADKIDDMRAKLEEKKGADINATASQSEYTEEVQEGAEALDGQTKATEDATSALKLYNDALRAQFDPLFAAVSSTHALADANSEVTAKEMELAAAIRDHGAESVEAMVAQDELTRAYEDASGAALDQEAALLGLVDMVRQQPSALDAAKAKLQQWVDQGIITQESADATAAKFDEVTTAAESIPVAVNTNVTSTGTTQTAADLNALKAKTDAIPREINIVTRMTQILGGSTNIPLRDSGGPVTAGHAYMIGVNRKPELFIPDENGTVVPMSSSISGGGGWGGGGGPAVTVVVNNPIVASEAEFRRMVTRATNQGLASGEINVRGRRVM